LHDSFRAMNRRDDRAVDAPRFRHFPGCEQLGSETSALTAPHTTSASHRIFVYGTLLCGGSNHGCLDGARFLRQGKTRPEFTLYDLGEYPAMVSGGKTTIYGELYEVSSEVRQRLDALEEHPTYYRRTMLELADGTVVETYLLPRKYVRQRSSIPTGIWPVRHAPPPLATEGSTLAVNGSALNRAAPGL
jgi:gamma-glutamylcyclotransferase (GGCT)/AIG2-like uncharacterized protein YtfP